VTSALADGPISLSSTRSLAEINRVAVVSMSDERPWQAAAPEDAWADVARARAAEAAPAIRRKPLTMTVPPSD